MKCYAKIFMRSKLRYRFLFIFFAYKLCKNMYFIMDISILIT